MLPLAVEPGEHTTLARPHSGCEISDVAASLGRPIQPPRHDTTCTCTYRSAKKERLEGDRAASSFLAEWRRSEWRRQDQAV